jgi:hypothetical protein
MILLVVFLDSIRVFSTAVLDRTGGRICNACFTAPPSAQVDATQRKKVRFFRLRNHQAQQNLIKSSQAIVVKRFQLIFELGRPATIHADHLHSKGRRSGRKGSLGLCSLNSRHLSGNLASRFSDFAIYSASMR